MMAAEQETFAFVQKDKPPEEDMIMKQKQAELNTAVTAPVPLTPAQKESHFFSEFGLMAIASLVGLTKGAPIASTKIKVAESGTSQDLDEILVQGMVQAGNELDEKYKVGGGMLPELRYVLFGGALIMVKGRLNNIRAFFANMAKGGGGAPQPQPMHPEQAAPAEKGPTNFAEDQVDLNSMVK